MRQRYVSWVAGVLLSISCAGQRAEENGTSAPNAPVQQAASAAPAATAAARAPSAPAPRGRAYPPTRVQDISEQIFGQTVRDPYRWLEDVKSPEVQAWMAAEDHRAREELAKLPGRDALVARFTELLYVESVTPPQHRGNRFFYSRRHADKEKSIVYFRDGERGKEQVLIDPNGLSPDGSISLHGWVPTWDGKSVAYSLHQNNADYGTLHVMNVGSRKVSAVDTIENVRRPGSWTQKGDGFYYTSFPDNPGVPAAERMGQSEIRFHKSGTDPKKDLLIYEKIGDPEKMQVAEISRDGHWLMRYVIKGTGQANDVYYQDLRKRDRTWRPLVADVDAAFQVEVWKDRFYIHTNDHAPNWRVYVADGNHPDRESWKEIVPEDKESVLEASSIVGQRLALTYLRNVRSEIELRTLDGAPLRKVSLPSIGSTRGIGGDPEQDDAYYSFSSFTKPPDIYKTSIQKGGSAVWFSLKVPIDPAPYEIEQLWFASKDGTKVPMFVVHRKDMPRDGSTPFLLTGYGGFNLSQLPGFASSIYPWLEAGGGYALANMRGGGEFGEAWHKAGMKTHKQNVFDDFIGAAEHLVKSGYTRPERLAIRGGSNGGLLMGAALTQRPDLFRAVICLVPLLDMVRTEQFGLARSWVAEYGSAKNQNEFEAIYAYSPYHHVKAGTAYPALLMMSADSDDRVDPMHARKMTAALQAANASDQPIWLRIEHNASHGGADLVKQTVQQLGDSYAFVMHEVGLTPRKGGVLAKQ